MFREDLCPSFLSFLCNRFGVWSCRGGPAGPIQSFHQDHSLARLRLLGAAGLTRPPQVQEAEVCLQAEALPGSGGGAAAIVVARGSVVQVLLCTFGPITCSTAPGDRLNTFKVCHSREIWGSSPSACRHSPLSRSHSGDDAPLHSLRGPSTGEMRPKSDRETVLGRSRLQGLD